MLKVRSGNRADSTLILREDDIRMQRLDLFQIDAVDRQSAGLARFDLPVDFCTGGTQVDLRLRADRQRLRFGRKIAFVGPADQTFAQAECVDNFCGTGQKRDDSGRNQGIAG